MNFYIVFFTPIFYYKKAYKNYKSNTIFYLLIYKILFIRYLYTLFIY